MGANEQFNGRNGRRERSGRGKGRGRKRKNDGTEVAEEEKGKLAGRKRRCVVKAADE